MFSRFGTIRPILLRKSSNALRPSQIISTRRICGINNDNIIQYPSFSKNGCFHPFPDWLYRDIHSSVNLTTGRFTGRKKQSKQRRNASKAKIVDHAIKPQIELSKYDSNTKQPNRESELSVSNDFKRNTIQPINESLPENMISESRRRKEKMNDKKYDPFLISADGECKVQECKPKQLASLKWPALKNFKNNTDNDTSSANNDAKTCREENNENVNLKHELLPDLQFKESEVQLKEAPAKRQVADVSHDLLFSRQNYTTRKSIADQQIDLLATQPLPENASDAKITRIKEDLEIADSGKDNLPGEDHSSTTSLKLDTKIVNNSDLKLNDDVTEKELDSQKFSGNFLNGIEVKPDVHSKEEPEHLRIPDCSQVFVKSSHHHYLGLTDEECELNIMNISGRSKHRLNYLKVEMELMKNRKIPTPLMNARKWLQLLQLGYSKAKRETLLQKWVAQEKEMLSESPIEATDDLQVETGSGKCDSLLGNANMFVRSSAMRQHYRDNMAYGMMHGQPLVLDFSLVNNINLEGIQNLVQQYQKAYTNIKASPLPYSLHICGADGANRLVKQARRSDPNWDILVNTFPNSYLDIFPRENLLYLSPDSPNVLKKIGSDDILIVGALCDKGMAVPTTLEKAKSEKIRHARLPIADYSDWPNADECITLDQTIQILVEYRLSQSWLKAMKHLPTGKLETKRYDSKSVLKALKLDGFFGK